MFDTPEKSEVNEGLDQLFNQAIDAWCEKFPPATDPENCGTVSMYEIVEALDSFYGMHEYYKGTTVYTALQQRGYKSIYDAVSNTFKIMVGN